MDSVVKNQQSFDKMLEVFGSYKEMAQKLNMKYVTVYAWSMRNSIPKKHHKAIIEASEGKLTSKDLE
jgi:DNA-binding transcriptional regulator YdaS (Cro superfamily)